MYVYTLHILPIWFEGIWFNGLGEVVKFGSGQTDQTGGSKGGLGGGGLPPSRDFVVLVSMQGVVENIENVTF